MAGTSTRFILLWFTVFLSTANGAFSQETAILAPDGSATSLRFASALEQALREKTRVTDSELAATVLKAQAPATPYNLTLREARHLGSGIGCSHFVLVRGDNQRRSSFEREVFFEAFAAVYLVDSRSGEMILWRLFNAKEDDPGRALKTLIARASDAAAVLGESIRSDYANRGRVIASVQTTLAADADDTLRMPLPYRRLKPRYTTIADYYGVEATVDIEVALDADGVVKSTRIVRWAGFGLDESVESAVREMIWRPADRRGKSLAMTVLLRYNFKDLDNEEPSF